MKKRLVSLLLIIALVLPMLSVCVFAEDAEVSEPLPLSEELLAAVENAKGVEDPAAADDLLARYDETRQNSTAPSHAARGTNTRTSYYCNLFYVAFCAQDYGYYSGGSYSLAFSLDDDGYEYFVLISYTPNDAELMFAIEADTPSVGTEYVFVVYDLILGALKDDQVLFSWDYGSTTYNGYAYLDPMYFSEDSVMTVYYNAPTSMGQFFADSMVSLLKLGIICWNSLVEDYTGLNMGDLGYPSYYVPTYNMVPIHDFRETSPGTYICHFCGYTYYDFSGDSPFVDVRASDYFYEPVLWAVDHGITNGTGYYTFSPNDPCTRGQIVTFLWRTAGCPTPDSYNNPFDDVYPSDYYYEAVLWAVDWGITNGIDYGKFGPNQACTRGQVVTFLGRFFHPCGSYTDNTFTDVYPWDYYYDAVLWAVGIGITNGTGNNRFSPNEPCTRGQIVTFLYRAFNY